MKKRRGDNVGILIAVLLVIVLGFILIKSLQERAAELSEQRIEQLFSPALLNTYPPPLSLQNSSFYQAGFIPSKPLKSYMLAFTDDDLTDTYQHLIKFQEGLNGLSLNSALAIDSALAESLVAAAEEVSMAEENDKEACGYFNALLNPSLLVLDLTLWTGQSEIYKTLQNYQDTGIQCEFYFPALKHGMLAYHPTMARIVQRTLFCDLSEERAKCFSAWNYFWKFAADPQEGPINYGAGCTLTDWMLQGFVCVNGIDLHSSPGRIVQQELTYRQYRKIHDKMFPLSNSSFIAERDVKDSFHNVLGASGKDILDNVKRKCSKVRDKASLYGDLAIGINGAPEGSLGSFSPLTGGITGLRTNAELNLGTGSEEDLQQQYEKAMLFASLFTEACMQDYSNLGNSLGGGIDGLGGRNLNTPLSCVVADLVGEGSSQLRETVECFDRFGQQQKMGALIGKGDSMQGIPDSNCKISNHAPREVLESLTPPSAMEKTLYEKLKGNSDFRVVDPYVFSSLCSTCDPNKLKAFTPIVETVDENGNTVDAKQDGPIIYQEGYQQKEIIKHEEWHASCPQCTEEQVKELTEKGKDPPKKTVTPEEAKEYCPDCTTLPGDKKKAGYPGPEGEDTCSAQAQRMEALLNCMGPVHKETFTPPPPGRPSPDPAPDDVGQDFTPCTEAVSTDGMFNNPPVGARDDCMFGDQDCNFPGAYYGGMIQGKINKKCQYVEDDAGLQCLSGSLGIKMGIG